jgi:hypothetical protein
MSNIYLFIHEKRAHSCEEIAGAKHQKASSCKIIPAINQKFTV